MDHKQLLMGGAILMLATTGCGQQLDDMPWSIPRSLSKERGDVVGLATASGQGSGPHAENPTGVMQLEQAVVLALAHNPDLASADLGVRAARAQAFQEGRRPNPELEVELEEFGGTGDLSGTGGSAATVALSQIVELGGKRARRSQVAELEKTIAEKERDAARVELVKEVSLAFTDVLALQERLALVQEMVEISEKTRSAIAQRVSAGKAPELEAMQARLASSQARLLRNRVKRELGAARDRLARQWGAPAPAFTEVEGKIHELDKAPDLAHLLKRAGTNVNVILIEAEKQAAAARVSLERANARPDLGITGGIQHFSETGDSSLVVGLAIPLRVNDRRRGGIARSHFEAEQAIQILRAARIDAQVAIRRAHGELAQSRDEAIRLRDEVLPTARRAFEVAQEGYARGKFSYLDVLAAQNGLIEAQDQYIDVLVEYRAAVVEIQSLVGDGVAPFAPAQEE